MNQGCPADARTALATAAPIIAAASFPPGFIHSGQAPASRSARRGRSGRRSHAPRPPDEVGLRKVTPSGTGLPSAASNMSVLSPARSASIACPSRPPSKTSAQDSTEPLTLLVCARLGSPPQSLFLPAQACPRAGHGRGTLGTRGRPCMASTLEHGSVWPPASAAAWTRGSASCLAFEAAAPGAWHTTRASAVIALCQAARAAPLAARRIARTARLTRYPSRVPQPH